MTQKTDAELTTEIDANITTNGTGAITGAKLNTVLKDVNDSKVNKGVIGVANGVAGLDSTGKVPAAQLPTGGGGSAAWGGITGTLSAQSDLQSALDAKAGSTATTTALANKVDNSAFSSFQTSNTAAINAKADASATTNALNSKADASAVAAALNLKANIPTAPTIPLANAGIRTNAAGEFTTAAIIQHDPVRYATAAALPANTYSNGTAGVGATITANANGALTIDGASPVNGNRVLINNEALGYKNGIYTVTDAGSGSSPFVLTRGNYSSVGTNMVAGTQVFVQEGTANAGKNFYQQTAGAITIGTTNLSFAPQAGSGGGAVSSVNTKTGVVVLTPNDIGPYQGAKAQYGCKGDAKFVTDAVVTSGSTALTSATANFQPSDVGKVIAIPYAGTDRGSSPFVGATFQTTIQAYVSATQVTLAAAPVKSIVGARTITDGSMTKNSKTLNSATGNFTIQDVGKFVILPQVGLLVSNSGGNPQPCWITKYNSATSVDVSRPALITATGMTVTIPGAWVQWGTDDTAALQTAINTSAAAGHKLFIEAGRYLITSSLVPLSNMSLFGEGAGRSIIAPVGATYGAIQYLGTTGTPLNDVTIENLEFDGMGVTVNTYGTTNKALYMRPMIRPVFRDLYVHDFSATGIGCDFLRDYLMENIKANHNGRQVAEFGSGGGGSGIGIGTGTWTEEAGLVIGCTTDDNGNNGIFTESQSSNVMSRGIRIIGNDSRWNGNSGISDRACEGTVIQGNTTEYNGLAGISALEGFVAGLYSKDLLINGNQSRNNPTNILCSWKEGGLFISDNVCSASTSGANGSINISPIASGTQTILNIKDNNINESTRNAIQVVNVASSVIPVIDITNNSMLNGGNSTSTRRAAIQMGVQSCQRLYVTGNKAIDTRASAAKTGSYGLEITAGTIDLLFNQNNEFSSMRDGNVFITAGTITDMVSTPNSGTFRAITTGTADTATTSDNTISWQSASATKNQTIPGAGPTNKGVILNIVDGNGTATVGTPIIITPASGTVAGAATLSVTTTRGTYQLQSDGVSNWAVI